MGFGAATRRQPSAPRCARVLCATMATWIDADPVHAGGPAELGCRALELALRVRPGPLRARGAGAGWRVF
jgi:hypothetical protein